MAGEAIFTEGGREMDHQAQGGRHELDAAAWLCCV